MPPVPLPVALAEPPDAEARIRRLERRLERERAARTEAEALLEEKSRALYEVNRQLGRFAAELEARVEERTRELADARAHAVDLAERDGLTGLASRTRFVRALDESLEHRPERWPPAFGEKPMRHENPAHRPGYDIQDDALATARRDGARFALLLIDLDRFKDINDSLGHEAGDVFLRRTARRLKSLLGPAALVARLGGDEFAALLPAPPGTDLARLGAELAAAIRRPVAHRGRSLEASCSVGIAVFPDDARTGGELQRFADIALYRSKAERGRATLFEPAMGRAVEARHALGADLARAIREGGIVPWFQPIVDGTDCRPVGAEALARWTHPTLGFLPPSAFIGLAEERGLMPDLFAAMMRRACPLTKAWIMAGRLDYLSVNLSPSQFKAGSVADEVFGLLDELDFPAHALTVEITEEVLLNDLDRARAQLERLAARGVRIALDDFGVGYANIGYLRQLPIHTLKLDRLLTQDVAADHKARSILSAMVQIARALDLRLVAEGVEDSSQALWLIHLGCRQLQGYLFGRPMPADDFAGHLGLTAARSVA